MSRDPRWIQTATSMTPHIVEERCTIAIRDIMTHKAGMIELADIDDRGVAHIPVPRIVRERNPGFPETMEFKSKTSATTPGLHDTQALLLWLDHSYYDPAQAAIQMGRRKIDHAMYREKLGASSTYEYRFTATKSDLQCFVRAIASLLYIKSGKQLKIPLAADWIHTVGDESHNTPPTGILLMAPREYEDVLIRDVYDLIHEIPPIKTESLAR